MIHSNLNNNEPLIELLYDICEDDNFIETSELLYQKVLSLLKEDSNSNSQKLNKISLLLKNAHPTELLTKEDKLALIQSEEIINKKSSHWNKLIKAKKKLKHLKTYYKKDKDSINYIKTLTEKYNKFIDDYINGMRSYKSNHPWRNEYFNPVWLIGYNSKNNRVYRLFLKKSYWNLMPMRAHDDPNNKTFFLRSEESSYIRRNKNGSHLVLNTDEIHFKYNFKCGLDNKPILKNEELNPISPITTFAVQALDELLELNVVSETDLIILKQGDFSCPILASKTVKGTNLKEKLNKNKNVSFDKESFAKLILLSLFARPHDWTLENFIINEKLYSIDNDLSFELEILTVKGGYAFGIRNVLLCFKNEMQKEVPESLKKSILKINPELFVLKWLIKLVKRSINLKDFERLLGGDSLINVLNIDQLPEIAMEILRTFKKIKEKLRVDINLSELVSSCHLALSKTCEGAWKEYDNDVDEIFNVITKIQVNESRNNFYDIPEKYINDNSVEGRFYFVEKRCKTPINILESFMKDVFSFENLSENETLEIMTGLKKIDCLKELTIRKLKKFRQYNEYIPTVRKFHLIDCDDITEEELIAYVGGNLGVELHLQNCPKISPYRMVQPSSRCEKIYLHLHNKNNEIEILEYTRSGDKLLYDAIEKKLKSDIITNIIQMHPKSICNFFDTCLDVKNHKKTLDMIAAFFEEINFENINNNNNHQNINSLALLDHLTEFKDMYKKMNDSLRIDLYNILSERFRLKNPPLWESIYNSIRSVQNSDGWCPQNSERLYLWKKKLRPLFEREVYDTNEEISLTQNNNMLIQLKNIDDFNGKTLKTYLLKSKIKEQILNHFEKNTTSEDVMYINIDEKKENKIQFICNLNPEDICQEQLYYSIDDSLGNDSVDCGTAVCLIAHTKGNESIRRIAYLRENRSHIENPQTSVHDKSFSDIDVSNIDMISYSKIFLFMLIVMPFEVSDKNIFFEKVCLNKDQEMFNIKQIKDGIKLYNSLNASYSPTTLSIKNIIFCMDELLKPLNEDVIEQFLKISLNLWFKRVIQTYKDEIQYLQKLHESAYKIESINKNFSPNIISIERFEQSYIRAQLIQAKLISIKYFSKEITGLEIFHVAEPDIAKFHEHLFKDTNASESFKATFNKKFIERYNSSNEYYNWYHKQHPEPKISSILKHLKNNSSAKKLSIFLDDEDLPHKQIISSDQLRKYFDALEELVKKLETRYRTSLSDLIISLKNGKQESFDNVFEENSGFSEREQSFLLTIYLEFIVSNSSKTKLDLDFIKNEFKKFKLSEKENVVNSDLFKLKVLRFCFNFYSNPTANEKDKNKAIDFLKFFKFFGLKLSNTIIDNQNIIEYLIRNEKKKLLEAIREITLIENIDTNIKSEEYILINLIFSTHKDGKLSLLSVIDDLDIEVNHEKFLKFIGFIKWLRRNFINEKSNYPCVQLDLNNNLVYFYEQMGKIKNHCLEIEKFVGISAKKYFKEKKDLSIITNPTNTEKSRKNGSLVKTYLKIILEKSNFKIDDLTLALYDYLDNFIEVIKLIPLNHMTKPNIELICKTLSIIQNLINFHSDNFIEKILGLSEPELKKHVKSYLQHIFEIIDDLKIKYNTGDKKIYNANILINVINKNKNLEFSLNKSLWCKKLFSVYKFSSKDDKKLLFDFISKNKEIKSAMEDESDNIPFLYHVAKEHGGAEILLALKQLDSLEDDVFNKIIFSQDKNGGINALNLISNSGESNFLQENLKGIEIIQWYDRKNLYKKLIETSYPYNEIDNNIEKIKNLSNNFKEKYFSADEKKYYNNPYNKKNIIETYITGQICRTDTQITIFAHQIRCWVVAFLNFVMHFEHNLFNNTNLKMIFDIINILLASIKDSFRKSFKHKINLKQDNNDTNDKENILKNFEEIYDSLREFSLLISSIANTQKKHHQNSFSFKFNPNRTNKRQITIGSTKKHSMAEPERDERDNLTVHPSGPLQSEYTLSFFTLKSKELKSYKEQTFQLEKVKSDDGFAALGLTRQQAYDLLAKKINTDWSDPKTLHVLAFLIQKKLYIWKPSDLAENITPDNDNYEDKTNTFTEVIHILHTSFDHFDKLIPLKSKEEEIQRKNTLGHSHIQ